MPKEADTTAERLKRELKEEIAAFQAQKRPEQQPASPANSVRTVDLPDFSPVEEPELAATPAVAASGKRPAEGPAGAASSSEPAPRQYKYEFNC